MEKINEIRSKYINALLITGIVEFVLFVLFIAAGFFAGTFIFLMFEIVTFVIIYSVLNGKYTKMVKNETLINLLKEHFVVKDYDFKASIDEETVRHSGLIQMGNRFHGDDYFELEYKNINIKRCDLKIDNVTSNGKSTSTVNYFTGQFLMIDINKNFDEYLQIREKEFFGINGNHKYQKKFFENVEKVKLESIEFNEKFNVYSSDGHTTFYVLTPKFMESLIKLQDKIDGQFALSFLGGMLYFSVHNKANLFEVSLLESVEEYISSVRLEVLQIKEFIDELIDKNVLEAGEV